MVKIKDGFNGERSIVVPKIIIEMIKNDPLASMLYISDIGYYPVAAHHYRQRITPIDQYIFIYCIDGAGKYCIGSHEYKVKANQYFILPANVSHKYTSDDSNPWTIYWIHFTGPLAKHYASDATVPMDINPGIHSRINNRINLFEEIFITLNSGYSLENIRYAMSLFHHYLGSLRYIQQYREVGENIENGNIVEAIIHYMEENIERHITLNNLAAYTGYSASHLSSLFKTKTGHSPMNYFNLLKIQQACQLLNSSTMKLTQICFKLGIKDPYYFSRLFSKIMGISPRNYRNKQKA